MVEYYAQRASVPGTLLISEATAVNSRSAALPNTPGLYTEEQINSWKPITKAVHEKGSYIYVQLQIVGRSARPGAVKRGADVFGPSDIPVSSENPIPRPLREEEILQFIQDYRQAAENAIKAGFDGVEIHGANGYLIDQFSQDISNQRTDGWGGSIEKRARFGIEISKAIAEAIGADRVGYRVSPWSKHHGMGMEDPVPQFTYLAHELKKLKLAYLHIVEARIKGNADVDSQESIEWLVDAWENVTPVIVAGGYTLESSKEALDKTYRDKDVLIAFGRAFVSNPDLPFRLEKGLPIAKHIRELFYEVGKPEGYTDYPMSAAFIQQATLEA